MKNKFLKLFLATVCVATLSFSGNTMVFANEAESIAESIDTETEENEISEENTEIVETENQDIDETEDLEENTEEETDESAESSSAVINTEDIFTTTSDNDNNNSGIFVDGEKIDKNVWVTITTKSDGESSLSKGTKFVVTFESTTLSNYRKEVTLDLEHNFSGSIELPADEYYISSYSKIGGETSNATLVLDNEEPNMLFTENTEIQFTVKGDIKASVSEETDEPIEEKPAEKETNFWLELLKNNIIFLVLLLGCGGFLLFYRLRQDAE